jgi:hypothetical protein
MTIALSKPGPAGLSEVVRVLREWQHDGAPVQLHPGDLGWYWRFGTEATAAAVRSWSRDGHILAVGLLDGPALLRVAIAPAAQHDEELARQMSADVTQPARGVLPPGAAAVEARFGVLFQGLLLDAGWHATIRVSRHRAIDPLTTRIERSDPTRVILGVRGPRLLPDALRAAQRLADAAVA